MTFYLFFRSVDGWTYSRLCKRFHSSRIRFSGNSSNPNWRVQIDCDLDSLLEVL